MQTSFMLSGKITTYKSPTGFTGEALKLPHPLEPQFYLWWFLAKFSSQVWYELQVMCVLSTFYSLPGKMWIPFYLFRLPFCIQIKILLYSLERQHLSDVVELCHVKAGEIQIWRGKLINDELSEYTLKSGFLNLGPRFFLPLSSALSIFFWRKSESMLRCFSEHYIRNTDLVDSLSGFISQICH